MSAIRARQPVAHSSNWATRQRGDAGDDGQPQPQTFTLNLARTKRALNCARLGRFYTRTIVRDVIEQIDPGPHEVHLNVCAFAA